MGRRPASPPVRIRQIDIRGDVGVALPP
ncbi:30S ribosomal protein S13, partial [Streptomyces sp. SID7982]|nr:30S ribosomal protein S13 [Streptomyces sp. SID7982]